jgi:hypothetical protein
MRHTVLSSSCRALVRVVWVYAKKRARSEKRGRSPPQSPKASNAPLSRGSWDAPRDRARAPTMVEKNPIEFGPLRLYGTNSAGLENGRPQKSAM